MLWQAAAQKHEGAVRTLDTDVFTRFAVSIDSFDRTCPLAVLGWGAGRGLVVCDTRDAECRVRAGWEGGKETCGQRMCMEEMRLLTARQVTRVCSEQGVRSIGHVELSLSQGTMHFAQKRWPSRHWYALWRVMQHMGQMKSCGTGSRKSSGSMMERRARGFAGWDRGWADLRDGRKKSNAYTRLSPS